MRGRAAIVRLLLGALWLLTAATGPAAAFDQSHAVLTGLLERHVRDGLVDYPDLQTERSLLQAYLASLGDLTDAEFRSFTPDQQLALLIDAYNAFTLELILRHYPVASIQDIPQAWDKTIWKLAGHRVSLNQIEHEWIRARFRQPLVHMALVCASRGCPPLHAAAYTADGLAEQLADAARNYARDPHLMRLDMKQDTLWVTKIFEWYPEDFVAVWGLTDVPEGSVRKRSHRIVIGFAEEYLPPAPAQYLRTHPVAVSYLTYDWSLNEAPSAQGE
jgi:hypothetical protein